jgi:hypothetical protein
MSPTAKQGIAFYTPVPTHRQARGWVRCGSRRERLDMPVVALAFAAASPGVTLKKCTFDGADGNDYIQLIG